MKYRHAISALLLLTVLLTPVFAFAQTGSTLTAKQKNQLLKEISVLLQEVTRLQSLLIKVQNTEKPAVYETTIFKIPFESIYFTSTGKLVATNNKAVRPTDRSIYELFVKIIGLERVKKDISEWRIFYGEKDDLGGFVELIPKTGKWVVGINREGYLAGDTATEKSYADLFIHEYAHIIFYSAPEQVASYKEQFWTKADEAQRLRLEQLPTSKRFAAQVKYYNDNYSRFVTDYATLSVDEDMAETFVAFILEDRPVADNVKTKKINFFYKDSGLVKLRQEFRENLVELELI